VFWVLSVYFNIRNTLPKFCPFLLGHPVYPEKKLCLPKYTALHYDISTIEVYKCFPKAGCTFSANDASTKGEKHILKKEILKIQNFSRSASLFHSVSCSLLCEGAGLEVLQCKQVVRIGRDRGAHSCWTFNLVYDSAVGVGVSEEEADSILGALVN